jgi:hypothetical protein
MSSKASRDDMRVVLGRAVGLALEAYRGSCGDKDCSGASRTRSVRLEQYIQFAWHAIVICIHGNTAERAIFSHELYLQV